MDKELESYMYLGQEIWPDCRKVQEITRRILMEWASQLQETEYPMSESNRGKWQSTCLVARMENET